MRHMEVVPFLLPADLTDLFMLASWQHPQLYLDPQVRAGISSFALADATDVEIGLDRLKRDLVPVCPKVEALYVSGQQWV